MSGGRKRVTPRARHTGGENDWVDTGPCDCWTHHAMVTPFHYGHCCFWPTTNTCHPEFVEQWERDRDRRLSYDVR